MTALDLRAERLINELLGHCDWRHMASQLVFEPMSPTDLIRKFSDALAVADAAAPSGWQPIADAVKGAEPIWAIMRSDIYPTLCPGRPDLERWNGVQVPLRHTGITEDGFDIGWAIAAPVGNGGFPDEWIAGWMPMPAQPAAALCVEATNG